jgi:DNA-binding transcriptional ArsR family regulator
MERLDATFTALADPTRRAILARLSSGEASVSDLADPFPMSLPALLKHVEALERAGLLRSRKEGRVRRCQLEAAPLAEAADWIGHYRQFWESRLDALDRYLRQTHHEENVPWPSPRKAPSPSAPSAPSRRRVRRSSVPGSIRKR